MSKEYYKRRLPHLQPKNGVFNICFRLAGTLPREKVIQLKQERTLQIKQLRKSIEDEELLKSILQKEQILYFGKYDELLDNGNYGPHFLKQPAIAALVAECFLYWHNQGRYKLVCYAIMPNHVHVILYKIQKPLFRILQTIKIYTAKEANKLLDRTGEAFWHSESYDNLIRNREEFRIKVQYVLMNAVKAKLVKNWQDFEFVYLNPEFDHFAP